MDSREAQRLAEQAKARHQVPDDAQVTSVERRYIETVGPDPRVPAPVRDVLAWIVHLQRGRAWVDLAVADATGEIVRVEWSRARLGRRHDR